MHIQISLESGAMKEKTPGFCFSGFLIMMEMPRLMNGLEKSITLSRIEEMVRGARAKSASCKKEETSMLCQDGVFVKQLGENRPFNWSQVGLFRLQFFTRGLIHSLVSTYVSRELPHHAVPGPV